MPDDLRYELLDAGDGRRLERFGARIVDRPAPGTTEPRRDPAHWARAALRFDRETGWTGARRDPWQIELGGLRLELRATDAGQVGLFPEHATLWPWLDERLAASTGTEVLHLFAYTGATTLALARAGARVAHVDASRPTVAWARANARLSGLDDRPIRWLVDDAAAFAAREARRGRRYAGVVLDPPAWGHADGHRWRLEDALPGLLATVGDLLTDDGWVVLTAHSVGWDGDRLADALRRALPNADVAHEPLVLQAASGATLHAGAVARAMMRP